MVDTGGTIANAAVALRERGARAVYACATHALFSGEAAAKLAASPLEEMVVTNTIQIPEERRFPQLKVLSVAELLCARHPLHPFERVGEPALRAEHTR